DPNSIRLIESFLAAGKPVALVCHAPGVLRHVKTGAGKPLVEGKNVTGFTDSEEADVGLTCTPSTAALEAKLQASIKWFLLPASATKPGSGRGETINSIGGVQNKQRSDRDQHLHCADGRN